MQRIGYKKLTSQTASFVLDNIPNTYDDLMICIFARSTAASYTDVASVLLNDTAPSKSLSLEIVNSAVGGTTSDRSGGFVAAGLETAAVFSNSILYVSEYTSSVEKIGTTESSNARNSNSVADVNVGYMSTKWDVGAVTRVTITPLSGSLWDVGSMFVIYGISRA